jgi:hypothetical protein
MSRLHSLPGRMFSCKADVYTLLLVASHGFKQLHTFREAIGHWMSLPPTR